MAALHSLGKKGSWQSCFERPFIILMPTEIASLINEHVPINKYRSTFYMYCISAVTRVEACAGMSFKYAWRTQGSRNWQLWAAACIFQCQTEDPWCHLDKMFPLHPSLEAVGRYSLCTLSGWDTLWMQQDLFVNWQTQQSWPVFGPSWSKEEKGSAATHVFPDWHNKAITHENYCLPGRSSGRCWVGVGSYCNALVQSNSWEETDPKWFKEQCQTSEAILVSQASQWMAPVLPQRPP